jgi:cation transport ATPase
VIAASDAVAVGLTETEAEAPTGARRAPAPGLDPQLHEHRPIGDGVNDVPALKEALRVLSV